MGAAIPRTVAALAMLATAVSISTAQTTVRVGSTGAMPGGTARVPIQLEDTSVALVGANVRLLYDDSILSNPTAAAANPDDQIQAYSPTDGEFNVVAYNVEAARAAPDFPVPAPGATAFYVDFDVDPMATPGAVAQVSFDGLISGPPDTPASGLSDATGVSVAHDTAPGGVTVLATTPTPSASPSPSPTASASPSVSPSASPTASVSPTPSVTPTGCPETIAPLPTEDLDHYYDVKVRPRSVIPTITRRAILIADPNSQANVRIRPNRDALQTPMIQTIATSGSFRNLNVKGASAQTVMADKQIKRLSFNDGYAREIHAGELGKARMKAYVPSDDGQYVHTSIFSDSEIPFGRRMKRAKGQFLGVILTNWDTPYQTADIKAQSKKYRDRATRTQHVALGQVSPQLDAAGQVIGECDSGVLAAELKKLMVKGGQLIPRFVWTTVPSRGTAKVFAKQQSFRLRPGGQVVAYGADVMADLVQLSSRNALIMAKGGDVRVYEIACAGNIRKLAAQLSFYRDETRTKIPVGGFLGVETPYRPVFGGLVGVETTYDMLAVSGLGNDPRAQDIKQLRGDTGITGVFYAGGTETAYGFDPTCAGRVKLIKTLRPGHRKLPPGVTPEINGLVQHDAQAREPRVRGDTDAIRDGRLVIDHCEPVRP